LLPSVGQSQTWASHIVHNLDCVAVLAARVRAEFSAGYGLVLAGKEQQ